MNELRELLNAIGLRLGMYTTELLNFDDCQESERRRINSSLLRSVDDLGCGDLSSGLAALQIRLVGELIQHQEDDIASVLSLERLIDVVSRLDDFGFTFGTSLPDWQREHLSSLAEVFCPPEQGSNAHRAERSKASDHSSTKVLIGGLNPTLEHLETQLAMYLRHHKPQAQLIISRYFGWDGTAGGTLQKVGDEFAVSRERVRQVIEKFKNGFSYVFPPSSLVEALKVTASSAPVLAEVVERNLQPHPEQYL